MAKINNADITKNITDELRIDTVIEAAPTDLGKTVVPTFVVNNVQKVSETYDYVNETQIVRSATILANSEITQTLFTTANLDNEDFFLVGCHLSKGQNSSYTGQEVSISVDIDGTTQKVLLLHGLNGLNESVAGLSTTFPRPIKVDRNTAITLDVTNNSSTMRAGGGIYGFVKSRVPANK